MRVMIRDIQHAVARRYKVGRDEIVSQARHRRLIVPRHVAMYLARELTALSMPAIGRHFGNRDHTTIFYAVNKIAVARLVDLELARRIDRIRGELIAMDGGTYDRDRTRGEGGCIPEMALACTRSGNQGT